MLAMDEVYQVLVDVAMDETFIYLEFPSVVFPPEVTTEVIREEDDLSARESTGHSHHHTL
jgi:hypothetical protein